MLKENDFEGLAAYANKNNRERAKKRVRELTEQRGDTYEKRTAIDVCGCSVTIWDVNDPNSKEPEFVRCEQHASSRLAEVTREAEDFEQAIADALGITGEYGFSELPERVATLRAELERLTTQLRESHESLQSTANVVAGLTGERDALQRKVKAFEVLSGSPKGMLEFCQANGLEHMKPQPTMDTWRKSIVEWANQ